MRAERGEREGESVLRLDGWLGFKCPVEDHRLVMDLRDVLDGMIRSIFYMHTQVNKYI